MTWEFFTGMSAAILGWMGLLEKRFTNLKQELEKQIEAVKELNSVEQRNLNDKVESIEKKIDFVIEQLLRDKR